MYSMCACRLRTCADGIDQASEGRQLLARGISCPDLAFGRGRGVDARQGRLERIRSAIARAAAATLKKPSPRTTPAGQYCGSRSASTVKITPAATQHAAMTIGGISQWNRISPSISRRAGRRRAGMAPVVLPVHIHQMVAVPADPVSVGPMIGRYVDRAASICSPPAPCRWKQ